MGSTPMEIKVVGRICANVLLKEEWSENGRCLEAITKLIVIGSYSCKQLEGTQLSLSPLCAA